MIQVADLARLNHENVGKLLGYCRESNPFSRMLVFEYASNGTLYEHLHCMFNIFFPSFVSLETCWCSCNSFHKLKVEAFWLIVDGEACQFSWTRRMNIIVGIARGLTYLHTELDPSFTISELNSSSIYLTDEFSPKVRQDHLSMVWIQT